MHTHLPVDHDFLDPFHGHIVATLLDHFLPSDFHPAFVFVHDAGAQFQSDTDGGRELLEVHLVEGALGAGNDAVVDGGSELADQDQFLARSVVQDNSHTIVDLQQVPVLLHAILDVVQPEGLYVRRILGQGTQPDLGNILHAEKVDLVHENTAVAIS